MWEKVEEILKSPKTWISVGIALIVIIVFIVMAIVEKATFKRENATKHHKMQIRIFNRVIRLLLVILAVIAILEINGVNVTSLIAGLGVATAVVGFALQDFLKDFIQGINIVWDNYFKVGDIIRYQGENWEVVDMTAKAVKLRNIDSSSILTVANRNIDTIEVLGDYMDVIVPGNYENTYDEMVRAIDAIMEKAKENKNIRKTGFIGADALEDSSVSYKIRVYCKPIVRDEVLRYMNSLILTELPANGVTIPYNQLDVHVDSGN